MLKRITPFVVICALSSAAYAQEKEPAATAAPGHFAENQAQIEALTERVLTAADENKDGMLSQAEAKIAKGHVAVAMRENLPKNSFISGGQVMLDRMERKILGSMIDFDRDLQVDKAELARFIVMCVGERERTLRSPVEAQYQVAMQEQSLNDYNAENRRAIAIQKLKQTEWQRLALQQRGRVWYENEMLKRIMAAEQMRDYLKMREREKNTPESPGQSAREPMMP